MHSERMPEDPSSLLNVKSEIENIEFVLHLAHIGLLVEFGIPDQLQASVSVRFGALHSWLNMVEKSSGMHRI